MSKTELETLSPIEFTTSQTKRPISEGAEKWLGVPIKVLDHGLICLIDYSGNDLSIEEAARISYGKGTRKTSETIGLIRYLRRHLHTTPFEMIDIKFHVKTPIFVARQWMRSRTASVNEESARYSILQEEFYLPPAEDLAIQSKTNRQGRGNVLKPEEAAEVLEILKGEAVGQYGHYKGMVNDDGNGPIDPNKPMVAREISRMVLGTNIYTQFIWKVNLHNAMRFEALRMDPHAQLEIRAYANAMATILGEAFPIAWKAFEDYELNQVRLTAPEISILHEVLGKGRVSITEADVLAAAKGIGLKNSRERDEMLDKFRRIRVISDS